MWLQRQWKDKTASETVFLITGVSFMFSHQEAFSTLDRFSGTESRCEFECIQTFTEEVEEMDQSSITLAT